MSAPVATFQCAAAADLLSRVGLKAWAKINEAVYKKNPKMRKLFCLNMQTWVGFLFWLAQFFCMLVSCHFSVIGGPCAPDETGWSS